MALLFAAVWIAGWMLLDGVDSTARWALVLGQTWRTGMSLPALLEAWLGPRLLRG